MKQEEKPSFFKRLFKPKDDGEKPSKFKLWLALGLFAVIIAIFISSLIPKNKTSSVSQKSDSTNSLALAYCREQENRLKNVLSTIKGIGHVEVFVAVDASPTYRYLTEEEVSKGENSEQNRTTVFEVKNGSITSPVVVVEQLPKILGVLVIATGAKDLMLKTTLINVISNILSVNISNVEVLEGRA